MPTVRLVPHRVPGRPQSEGLVEDGPTLHVHIGYDFSPVGNPSLPAEIPGESFLALIDTGSDENFIDTSLALSLALPQLREAAIAGVHGVERGFVFGAHFHIPELDYAVRGSAFGARLTESGLPYSFILGRTFLQHCVMNYDGRTGEVIVSTD